MSVCLSAVWLNVLPFLNYLIYFLYNRDITTSNPHIGALAFIIYTTYLNSFQKKMHYFFDHNIDHVLVEIFIRYNIMKNLGRQSIRIHRLLFWKHLTIGWPCKNAFMEYISLNLLNKQYKTIFLLVSLDLESLKSCRLVSKQWSHFIRYARLHRVFPYSVRVCDIEQR